MVALFYLQSEKNKKEINKLKKETKTRFGTNSSITRDNLTVVLKSNDFYVERSIFSKVEKNILIIDSIDSLTLDGKTIFFAIEYFIEFAKITGLDAVCIKRPLLYDKDYPTPYFEDIKKLIHPSSKLLIQKWNSFIFNDMHELDHLILLNQESFFNYLEIHRYLKDFFDNKKISLKKLNNTVTSYCTALNSRFVFLLDNNHFCIDLLKEENGISLKYFNDSFNVNKVIKTPNDINSIFSYTFK